MTRFVRLPGEVHCRRRHAGDTTECFSSSSQPESVNDGFLYKHWSTELVEMDRVSSSPRHILVHDKS
ncbi:uncharacterized protein YALI1_D16729g [Yarrowia lipolytica]|uniref:Uncharacterized protein n=1 Tax=Yarrowia lipolytica TaxID=4952 RepID=A0A1D8NEF9_YARLL|nr:hypothetical protein YALI1_D16729g [Yarrowia lipolytica]